MSQLGRAFTVRAADIDETPEVGEAPRDYVARLALAKATRARQDPREVVVAADTTVDVDDTILAKPADRQDARQMLQLLSGRSHFVHTGVALMWESGVEVIVVTSRVDFAELCDADVDWYLATGEGDDKAGAYALQGRAARFVRGVAGSVSNIIGLPMYDLIELARRNGVPLLGD